jgi:glycosyltransferase involved in cell wall biosynthesis
MRPHLLCIGGEDHSLRIPFLIGLRDQGFRICAAGSGDSAPFASAGLDYRRIDFQRFVSPSADLATLGSIERMIADVRPAVVQCFDTKMNILAPLAARRFREVGVVSTINGLGWLYSSRTPVALGLRPVHRALQRLVDRWTDITVFQNSDDLAFFERHKMVGSGKYFVIPGSGVEVERFARRPAAEASQEELRNALGLAGSEVVLTVTRMTKQKGVPTLLAAAALVHRSRPGVRFLLVGPRENEGRAAVSQSEIDRHAAYVKAIGSRSDVPALLRLADVFAFPTELFEGVPRVLLEAAVAGCPIVTTRMPGCTDVIRDGWSGYLVPPRSPRLLAERILDLLSNRSAAEAMGSCAATFVKREFSLQTTITRYAEAYESLLGRTRHHQGERGDKRRQANGDLAINGFRREQMERDNCADMGSVRAGNMCRSAADDS